LFAAKVVFTGTRPYLLKAGSAHHALSAHLALPAQVALFPAQIFPDPPTTSERMKSLAQPFRKTPGRTLLPFNHNLGL
jgi:hypothetical protein